MEHSENYYSKKTINSCDSCGAGLYDGDSAYILSGNVFCPACIESSLTICRPLDDLPRLTAHISSADTVIDGITHKEIRMKTREKARKTTANRGLQKG